MSPCSNGLAGPHRVGHLSFGSLSLTAVLFGSYQGENDHSSSEALRTAARTHTHMQECTEKCVSTCGLRFENNVLLNILNSFQCSSERLNRCGFA